MSSVHTISLPKHWPPKKQAEYCEFVESQHRRKAAAQRLPRMEQNPWDDRYIARNAGWPR